MTYTNRRTRVKICGITRTEDALKAVSLGADALGLVFYPASPRYVEIEQAARITASLPAFTSVVGLFVNAGEATIREVLQRVPISLLQFHGDEEPLECEIYDRPYIKAIRMSSQVELNRIMASHPYAAGFLLDAFHADAKGGTGLAFDWDMIPPGLSDSIILAGGLEPANIQEALARVKPYAVDVSSGVEAAKGVKDFGKMAEFIREIQHYDYRQNFDSCL
jgi:phosphoribosylanthranilate isomerase